MQMKRQKESYTYTNEYIKVSQKKEKYKKSRNTESTLESYEAWLDAQEDE